MHEINQINGLYKFNKNEFQKAITYEDLIAYRCRNSSLISYLRKKPSSSSGVYCSRIDFSSLDKNPFITVKRIFSP